MNDSKCVVGKCPICGDDVVKVQNGYACKASIKGIYGCEFFIPYTISHRRISTAEVSALLIGEELLLDGFSTPEGKMYSSLVSLTLEGSVHIVSKVSECPVCGGDVFVGIMGFNCANYNNYRSPCAFLVWRNIAGHNVTPSEVREICMEGKTRHPVQLFGLQGDCYYKYLGLSFDKSKIVKL